VAAFGQEVLAPFPGSEKRKVSAFSFCEWPRLKDHSHHWFADGARKPPHGSNFLSGIFVGLTRFAMAS
jgi:hypothetical protein